MTCSIFFDELHDMTIGELLVAVTGDATVASDGRWRSLTLGVGVGSEITAAPGEDGSAALPDQRIRIRQ